MSEAAHDVLLAVEDLPGLPDDDYRYELVAGHLVREPPPGREHGSVAAVLVAHLYPFVHERRLGRVFGEAGYVLASDPDTVRGPDVSFVSASRLAALPRRGPYLAAAPDLAIEVASPGNARSEILAKVGEYLAAGGRAVWVVDPRRRTVTVHSPRREAETLSSTGVLEGGSCLPAFRLPVAELFEP